MINAPTLPPIQIQDQLQNKLLQFIDYVGNMAQAGMDKAGTEIPLLLKEVATYGAVSNGVMAVLCLAAITFIVFLIFKMLKAVSKDKDASEDAIAGGLFIAFILGIVCIPLSLSFISNAKECMKATFAPRVYIVEWGFDVYNGNNSKIRINK